MMKFLIIPLTLIFIITSCSNSKNSTNDKDIEIKGVYVAEGIAMQHPTNIDSLSKSGLLDLDKIHFNFQDNDTVIIKPGPGIEFFSDSIFQYKWTDNLLILTNGNKRHEIPFVYDNFFRLEINDKEIKKLYLIHPKKN